MRNSSVIIVIVSSVFGLPATFGAYDCASHVQLQRQRPKKRLSIEMVPIHRGGFCVIWAHISLS